MQFFKKLYVSIIYVFLPLIVLALFQNDICFEDIGVNKLIGMYRNTGVGHSCFSWIVASSMSHLMICFGQQLNRYRLDAEVK